jgi:hypothetical protein
VIKTNSEGKNLTLGRKRKKIFDAWKNNLEFIFFSSLINDNI